ncbi:MAG: hypothetical protein MJZ79_04040 [Paludibacteraceae bacterium]|nr:hypothetical protein [Paludibacteraceae bacterium]
MKNDFQAINITLITPFEHNLLIQVDNFLYPIVGYKCLGNLHDELTVEISTSEKKRKYEIELNEPDSMTGESHFYKTTVNYPLLGEYISKNEINGPRVILYINSIRQAQPQQTELLLAEVYVHEMMHAYFDTTPNHTYEEKVEEPIAEYAMLKFFEAFDQGANCLKILTSAVNDVKAKQTCCGINCYGFGYYLYMKMGDTLWRELLLTAKSYDSRYLKLYVKPFNNGTYPFGIELKHARLLYLTLTNSATLLNQHSLSCGKHIRYITNISPTEGNILGKIQSHCIRLHYIADVQRYNRKKPINSFPFIFFHIETEHRQKNIYYVTKHQDIKAIPRNSFVITTKSSIPLSFLYACLSCHYIYIYNLLVNYRSWYGPTLEEVRDLPILIPDPLQIDNIRDFFDLAEFVVTGHSPQYQFEDEIEDVFQFSRDEIDYIHSHY